MEAFCLSLSNVATQDKFDTRALTIRKGIFNPDGEGSFVGALISGNEEISFVFLYLILFQTVHVYFLSCFQLIRRINTMQFILISNNDITF